MVLGLYTLLIEAISVQRNSAFMKEGERQTTLCLFQMKMLMMSSCKVSLEAMPPTLKPALGQLAS